jgi:adenine-specific DNA-methyltransferase
MNKMESNREKVRRLLRELFQFDAQDLDFGIYRILNFRRKEIERFIEEDLIRAVEAEFKEYAKAGMAELHMEVERLKTEINRDFGEGTIDAQGHVRKHEDMPKIKDYGKKVEELKGAEVSEAQMNEVFNHVYEFFSRYYDKGDFISKRRYGGREKYYVPYNGEEVVLHWANNDQYYIKTAEYFRSYSFRAGAYRVSFLLREAEVEANNVVGENKYFVLSDSHFINIDDEKRVVDVYFEWRALTDEEKRKFGTRNVQEALVVDAIDRIFSETSGSRVGGELRAKVNEEKTILERHLNNYVRRNTTDYFIHKNLKAFLERELEFYIKNEVVDLDELENLDEKGVRIARAKVKAIREISKKIIEFLAQIEDFQKLLFEKKKFIIGTEYVITLDKIKEYAGEEFLESIINEILKNSKQLEEWKDFLGIEIKSKKDLIEKQTVHGKEWKKLPIDTKNFGEDFKIELLERISEKNNVDKILNGILIKSENYHALNLLQARYKKSVKCIYIDPPYNTGSDEFLYKDNYKDSSWLTMMANRFELAQSMLDSGSIVATQISDVEDAKLKLILDSIFGPDEFVNRITVRTRSPSGFKIVNLGVFECAEYLYLYAKEKQELQMRQQFVETDYDPNYGLLISNIKEKPEKWEMIKLADAVAKELGYNTPEEARESIGKDAFHKSVSDSAIKHADSVFRYTEIDDVGAGRETVELKKTSQKSPEKVYVQHREGYRERYIKNGKEISFYVHKLREINGQKAPTVPLTNIWTDVSWEGIAGEGQVKLEKGKKPERLVQRIVDMSTNEGDLVMDYFVGSGTTCAAAMKMNRCWIGVEIDETLFAMALRRLKIVLFGDKTGISKNVKWSGGGAFKYMYLEQYEDTLNNLVFRAFDKTIQETLDTFGDYFMRYMLDYETRESPARLNPEKFQTPFNYKIRVINQNKEKEEIVDLVETFNYLLGLYVEKVRTFKDSDRSYRVVFGKHGEENVVVIWRDTKGIDFKKDKRFIEETILAEAKPDRIFVNGDSLVEKAEPIEPEFKRLMGA